MITNETIKNRFQELFFRMNSFQKSSNRIGIDTKDWEEWANSALTLLKICYSENSTYYKNLDNLYLNFHYFESEVQAARGIFTAAKNDYDSGFYYSLEKQISGEIFGDFIAVAKVALSENNKDVAAVLASAALEDVLKKYAMLNGLDVNDKTMAEVVNSLKSKSLVQGAQKSLLESMPRIRNYAMHADWDKITPQDVGAIIGFVENFLLNNF